MNCVAILKKQSKPVLIIIGITLIGVIGVVDFMIGYGLSFSVFYVLPISIVTWFTSRQFGLLASFVSAFVWFSADIATGRSYLNTLIPVWNTVIRLVFFVIITLLLSALKRAIQRESELARIDYLTGAINSRFFYELAQMEIDRFQRYKHPFTLTYIDLDNFKTVNDQLGHSIGDQVLRKVISSVKKNLRRTDVVARLGGDEFVLLLPETDQESAYVVINKIRGELLEEMRQQNWPITFSIGVLTCRVAPNTIDELIKMADDLMYSVKHDGKNAVKYFTCAA